MIRPLFVLLAVASLSLQAQDGPFWTGSKLKGTGSDPLPLTGERVFPKLPLKAPTDLLRYPGPGPARYLVVQLEGMIASFENQDDTTELVPFFQGEGRRLYSVVFDPQFPERPYCYLAWNKVLPKEGPGKAQGISTISRLTLSSLDPPIADPESELSIIEWSSRGHDGCDLKFGADGMLYASTGDGASPGDPENVGQTTDNLLGSILRIDVSSITADERYLIPQDNPFVGVDGIRPEVWAYGFRNPWKMEIHPSTGDLLLGDNGDEHWELVRHVERGTNHGWSAFEGSHLFRASNPLSGPVQELTLPVAEHSHQEMRSVIGGLFYEGKALSLSGHYLYGCYVMRTIWALPWSADEKGGAPIPLASLSAQVVDFCADENGEILVLGYEGTIHRLIETEAAEPLPIPMTLSATGLFESSANLKPAQGVVDYQINADSWSDGAQKVRHLALPPGEKIDARAGEGQKKSWKFPPGTALAQTFFEKKKPIETQVMHKDGYQWRYLSYRWRKDGSDADLVPAEGLVDEASGRRFLSRQECTVCHTQRSFFTLAASTAQLSEETENLNAMGWFKKNREPRPEKFPALANPHDPDAKLDKRARSYLHVNCAHCHRETGLGGRAQFQLLHWLDLPATGAVGTAPMIPLGGATNHQVIAPGKPDQSELYLRLVTEEAGRMPLLGCQKIDQEGAELIRQWIESMK